MIQRRVQFVLCYGHSDVPGRLDEGRYPVVCLGTDVALPVAAPDAAGQPLFELGRGELVPSPRLQRRIGFGPHTTRAVC